MSPRRNPLAGPGYVILNIIRVMNIVALLAVVIASWIMLVKTFNISKFFFFDAVSHVITSSLSLFLVISELNLLRSYFARNWPLLAPSSGFVTLGTLMIIVGVSILGNLNKEATSQESLGLPFWRIVIASGILAAVLGFVNILVSYIFRDKVLSITSRQVRSQGAVASSSLPTSNTPSASSSMRKPSSSSRHHHSKKHSFSLPTYTYRHHRNRSSTDAAERGHGVGPKVPINISRPIGQNPQFKDYVKQEETHATHPIYAEMSREANHVAVRMPEPVQVHPAHVQYMQGDRF